MGGSYQMRPRGYRQGIIERHFKHSHFNFKNNLNYECNCRVYQIWPASRNKVEDNGKQIGLRGTLLDSCEKKISGVMFYSKDKDNTIYRIKEYFGYTENNSYCILSSKWLVMAMTRKWTPEEDKKLMELWKSNYNIKAICTIINRSKNAIWKRLEVLRGK